MLRREPRAQGHAPTGAARARALRSSVRLVVAVAFVWNSLEPRDVPPLYFFVFVS